MSGHQSARSLTTSWITPPHIGPALGLFDLDPCEHTKMPWRLAKRGYTILDDGLKQPWEGSVWLNPPYDDVGAWMDRMRQHSYGIALLFARTEIDVWHQYIWPFCYSLFFFRGRLWFHDENGVRAKANAGAPSVLITYDEESAQRISDSHLEGRHVPINTVPVVIVGVSPSWQSVIQIAIGRIGKEADIPAIYELVEQIAPDKVNNNGNWREKIRQQLRQHFSRIERGIYSSKN